LPGGSAASGEKEVLKKEGRTPPIWLLTAKVGLHPADNEGCNNFAQRLFGAFSAFLLAFSLPHPSVKSYGTFEYAEFFSESFHQPNPNEPVIFALPKLSP
jgi:hypothetical protein